LLPVLAGQARVPDHHGAGRRREPPGDGAHLRSRPEHRPSVSGQSGRADGRRVELPDP
jgi:hypothetical protein